jgi:hypothetical protein
MKPEERTFTQLAAQICAPDFAASGLTDAELGELIDREIAAVRRERRERRARVQKQAANVNED